MRFALVGYGYWGEIVARTIARVGELSVIVEPSEERRTLARETWGPWGTRTVSSLTILPHDVEAVWIATPTASHFDDVRTSLDRGCHVLCEKPFVLHMAQAKTLVGWSHAENLVLKVGHLTLHSARHDAMKETEPLAWIHAVRRNTRASLSDGSVLAGVGPHEISPLIDLFGLPGDMTCTGTEHRVTFSLKWYPMGSPVVTATVELDWLAESRTRALLLDGVPLEVQDDTEPLLREAESFIQAVKYGMDREKWRQDALRVSQVLEELERLRSQA